MRYVSIDIETTGLNPETDQILEIGAVIEDTEQQVPLMNLPAFQTLVKWDRITGEPFALAMNAELLAAIAKDEGMSAWGAAQKFRNWLMDNGIKGGYNAAGKNFASFDNLFLSKVINWPPAFRRVLDPAVLYWLPGDEKLPGFSDCKKRAGMMGGVSHRALDDARDVVELIRRSHDFQRIWRSSKIEEASTSA